jgi:hypothetical protein
MINVGAEVTRLKWKMETPHVVSYNSKARP